MMVKKRKLVARTHDDCQRYIIRMLEKNEASGYRAHDVFEDWLLLVEATLREIPNHVANHLEGNPMTDSPETAALWDRMRNRYGDGDPERCKRYFDRFAEAFHWLCESSLMGYCDVIGNVYMLYAYPNPNKGQYFTPWAVARLMTSVTVGSGAKQIREQLTKAAQAAGDDPRVFALLLSMMTVPTYSDEWLDVMVTRFLPIIAPYYEPIMICDPTCGSGVMFLASAECFPTWAVQLGLVQFYGMDIDETCVRMARVNCMLYGLNGRYMESVLTMSEEEFQEMVPGAWKPIYTEVREAYENGDQEKVDEIAELLNRARQSPGGQQQALFEPKPIYFIEEMTECEMIAY